MKMPIYIYVYLDYLPIKNGDFYSYVKLPDGQSWVAIH